MKGLNPRPRSGGKFHIPRMRKANGHKPKTVNAKSRVSRLDTWGAHVEPGKYYGRFLSENAYFYLYGSWRGDAVSVHREEERDGDPVTCMYLTPSGGWWLKPLVFKPDAYGLDRLKTNFLEFVKTNPDLKNL